MKKPSIYKCSPHIKWIECVSMMLFLQFYRMVMSHFAIYESNVIYVIDHRCWVGRWLISTISIYANLSMPCNFLLKHDKFLCSFVPIEKRNEVVMNEWINNTIYRKFILMAHIKWWYVISFNLVIVNCFRVDIKCVSKCNLLKFIISNRKL